MPKEEVKSKQSLLALTIAWLAPLARQLDSPAVQAKQERVAEQDALIRFSGVPFGGIQSADRPPQK